MNDCPYDHSGNSDPCEVCMKQMEWDIEENKELYEALAADGDSDE